MWQLYFRILLTCLQLRGVCTMTAYDCQHQDTQIHPLNIAEPKPCPDPETDYEPPERLMAQVIQSSAKVTVGAFQCRLVVTKEVARCAWDRSNVYGTHWPLWQSVRPLPAADCRKAVTQEYYNYEGRSLQFRIGEPIEAQWFSHGKVSKNGKCTYVEEFESEGTTYEWSYQQVKAHFLVRKIVGELDTTTGNVYFPQIRINTKYNDGFIFDYQEGTVVWQHGEHDCRETVSEVYQGVTTIHRRKGRQGKLVDGILLINNTRTKQFAGLVIKHDQWTCNLNCYETHVKELIVCPYLEGKLLEPERMFRPAPNPQMINLHTAMGHMHLVTNLRVSASFREVQAMLCQVDRKTLFNKIQAVASDNNKYALMDLYGPGHTSFVAGAVAYIARCVATEVTLRGYPNCTQEIPAQKGNRTFFVNPITRIMQRFPTIIPCSDIMPVRWKLDIGEDTWYCSKPDVYQCQGVTTLSPLAPAKTDADFTTGLGRGIYTPEQLKAHAAYDTMMTTRGAVLAHITNAAAGSGTDNALGSTLTAQDFVRIEDHIIPGIMPFFWWLGDVWHYLTGFSMLYLILAIFGGWLIRSIALYRQRGFGWWLLAAVADSTMMLVAMPVNIVQSIWREMWAPHERQIRDDLEDRMDRLYQGLRALEEQVNAEAEAAQRLRITVDNLERGAALKEQIRIQLEQLEEWRRDRDRVRERERGSRASLHSSPAGATVTQTLPARRRTTTLPNIQTLLRPSAPNRPSMTESELIELTDPAPLRNLADSVTAHYQRLVTPERNARLHEIANTIGTVSQYAMDSLGPEPRPLRAHNQAADFATLRGRLQDMIQEDSTRDALFRQRRRDYEAGRLRGERSSQASVADTAVVEVDSASPPPPPVRDNPEAAPEAGVNEQWQLAKDREDERLG